MGFRVCPAKRTADPGGICRRQKLYPQRPLHQPKADMFTKRTIKPHQAVATVDTASEALAVSISEKACVDMSYMSRLTGKTKEALAGELQGVIFRVPGQLEQDGTPHYVTADEYLSGNVRRKLRQAQRAAQQDPSFAVNVEALTAAQPKDLDASEIEVRLGATWIDKEYIQQFMYETFNPPFYLQRSIEVNYSSFRVSAEELAVIEQKMSQFGTSNREAYLRKMALDGYVVKLELPELKELVSLMRRSSNNLNQLTRKVHETGRVYDADLEDISQRQEQLWEGVEEIITQLSKLL